MKTPEIKGSAEIVEGVGHAVWEAADYEERHAEEERQVAALPGEVDGRGHNHATADGEHATHEGSGREATTQDFLGHVLEVERRATEHETYEQTADDVASEDSREERKLPLADETGRPRVELQPIMHDGQEAERKSDSTDDGFLGKVAEAGDAYADAGEDGGAQSC